MNSSGLNQMLTQSMHAAPDRWRAFFLKHKISATDDANRLKQIGTAFERNKKTVAREINDILLQDEMQNFDGNKIFGGLGDVFSGLKTLFGEDEEQTEEPVEEQTEEPAEESVEEQTEKKKSNLTLILCIVAGVLVIGTIVTICILKNK